MNALVDKIRTRIAVKPAFSKVGHIGLHFAEEQAHAVQLRRLASGAYCLRAWASKPYQGTRDETLNNGAALKQLIASLLSSGSFKGRTVVTALTPAQTRITSLSFQASSSVPDDARIGQLMSERLDGSIGDYVIDYLPVRGSVNDREKVVLVTSCLRNDVLAYLDHLAKAHIEVAELEVGPAALNRLIGLLPKTESTHGNALVINFGSAQTYLTLISGRRLLMDKEVSFGAQLLIDQIARGLDISGKMAEEIAIREGLSPQSAKPFVTTGPLTTDDLNPVIEIVRPLFARLTEEIRRICLYAAAESKGEVVEQIYAFGSVARWPGADVLLSEIVGIPVACTLPLTAIFDAQDDSGLADYAGIGPELAIATGLALRGLCDGT